jgi:hypothetical protein
LKGEIMDKDVFASFLKRYIGLINEYDIKLVDGTSGELEIVVTYHRNGVRFGEMRAFDAPLYVVNNPNLIMVDTIKIKLENGGNEDVK